MNDNGTPLISISIPTYNQEETLPRAIASALMQTHSKIEVLVSDDSDSYSQYFLQGEIFADHRVNYKHNRTRLGLARNYHQGLVRARGKYFINLDGDDYFTDPNFLRFAIEALGNYPNAVALIGGQGIVEAKTGRLLEHQRPTDKSLEVIDGTKFFLRCIGSSSPILPHLATVVLTSAARNIHYYTADIINTDLHSIRRLMLTGSVLLTDRIAGNWSQSESNVSRISSPESLAQNIRCLLDPYDAAGIQSAIPQDELKRAIITGLHKYVRDTYSLFLRTSAPLAMISRFNHALSTAYPERSMLRDCIGILHYPRTLRNIIIRSIIGATRYNQLAALKQGLSVLAK